MTGPQGNSEFLDTLNVPRGEAFAESAFRSISLFSCFFTVTVAVWGDRNVLNLSKCRVEPMDQRILSK